MSTKNNDIEQEESESIDDIVGIILRQTTLTDEDARSRLFFHNNDYIKVIEEFMGTIHKKKPTQTLTINQQIYKEIRGVMDNASMNFYSKRDS